MAFAIKEMKTEEPEANPAQYVMERNFDGLFLKHPDGTLEKIVGPNGSTDEINEWFKSRNIPKESVIVPEVESLIDNSRPEIPVMSEAIQPVMEQEQIISPEVISEVSTENIELPEIIPTLNNDVVDNQEVAIKAWWGQNTFSNKRERFGLMLLVIGIIFISIVSVSHLVTYFGVGNNSIEAWFSAIAFEILSFGSIAAFVLLPRIKRWALWLSLLLLYVLQVFGNTYATFDYVNPEKAVHFFDFFGLNVSEVAGKRVVAILLSSILPTVSFIFTQLIKPYFKEKSESEIAN